MAAVRHTRRHRYWIPCTRHPQAAPGDLDREAYRSGFRSGIAVERLAQAGDQLAIELRAQVENDW
jgi:hypothetical protein